MFLRLSPRGLVLATLLFAASLTLILHAARGSSARLDLAHRVSALGLPSPLSVGGIDDESHRQLSNLQWHRPQWRIGASDSPEQAARRQWELARATQHAGTGARIHRFLEKARRGEPITVAAIGGSVSKGRGLRPPEQRPTFDSDGAQAALGADTLYSKENLHVLVFDWLNATFPHPENRFVNGAQGGVGAGYFAWCFKEHIYEDVDLVLVELGINDLNRMNGIPKFEHLVRSVLELDSSPAIINIETFTTLFPALISSSSLHGDVLAYYDVPSLSIRDIVLPRILADPDVQLPRWFRTGGDVTLGDDKVRQWGGVPVDLMHISAKGHALAAGLIINYLSSQLSLIAPSGWAAKLRPWRYQAPRVYDVPSTSLTQTFNPDDLPEKREPVCRSMNSAKWHNRVSGTDGMPGHADDERVLGLVLHDSSSGWEYWAWSEKRYLVAREPGALAVFDFITSEGEEQDRGDTGDIEDPMDVYEPSETVPYTETDAADMESETLLHDTETDADTPQLTGTRRTASRARSWKRSQVASKAGEATPDAQGTVAIGYQRSAHYGLGSVFCWVDDDEAGGRRLDGWWRIKERNMGVVDAVATGLRPGPHRLQCRLLPDTLDPQGRLEFRLFAIMHD